MLWLFQVTIRSRSSGPVLEVVQLLLRFRCRIVVGHASVVDDGSDECLVDDKQDASERSPCRSGYRPHEVQSYLPSVDDVVEVCCLCEALVEDDAEELHRLLDLDRDVIDLQDDICRDVLASSEENLLFVCLSTRTDAPMRDFQLAVFWVIWSNILLFVRLSARIDASIGDFQLGVFIWVNLVGGPAACLAFRWDRRSDGGLPFGCIRGILFVGPAFCLSLRMDLCFDGVFQLGVFGVIWVKVLLFVCLSARIGAAIGDFHLGVFWVIWLEFLLFMCLSIGSTVRFGTSNWVYLG